MSSTSTLRQIAELHSLPMAELQARWGELVGSSPPQYNRDFLISRLAHRLQELTYGGLTVGARQKMNALLDEAGYDETGAPPGKKRGAKAKRGLPVVGTRLIREWNGERHEVTVVQGGFECRG